MEEGDEDEMGIPVVRRQSKRAIAFVKETATTHNDCQPAPAHVSSTMDVAKFYRDFVASKPKKHVLKRLVGRSASTKTAHAAAKRSIDNDDTSKLEKTTHSISNHIWCETCGHKVPISQYALHKQSVGHLHSRVYETNNAEALTLKSDNVGFQLLQKQGWVYEHGLGPTGEGRRLPLKTAIKNDKHGLGLHRIRSKVTHTAEDILQQSKPKWIPDAEKRLDIVAQHEKDRRDRIAMLRYMNT